LGLSCALYYSILQLLAAYDIKIGPFLGFRSWKTSAVLLTIWVIPILACQSPP
jgi:hypothetical protein